MIINGILREPFTLEELLDLPNCLIEQIKVSILDSTKVKILEMHKQGYTQVKIAEELGFSRQYISQTLKKYKTLI